MEKASQIDRNTQVFFFIYVEDIQSYHSGKYDFLIRFEQERKSTRSK